MLFRSEEAVHTTHIPNLSVMTSGPKPMNATELFESQLLIDFIERAVEEYDHILFDSGPFLIMSVFGLGYNGYRRRHLGTWRRGQ